MLFKKIKKNKADENENRLRVLLALAGHKFAEPGPCPDPNDMAAFAQGTIDPQNRKLIEAHLHVCHECHAEYRNFSVVLNKPSPQSILSQIKKTALNFSDYFTLSRSIRIAGLTAATTTCLVLLYFWGLRSPPLSDQLAKTYTPKVLALVSINELKANSMLTLPWQRPETAFGFAPLQQFDPNARLAFGAGLYSAMHDLAGESETAPPPFMTKQWPDTQWAVDYWLGRWSYLTRGVAISGEMVGKVFWQKQSAIVSRFQNQYTAAHKEDEDVVRIADERLEHIQSILSKADDDILNQRMRDDLSAELGLLIELLSPGKEAVNPKRR